MKIYIIGGLLLLLQLPLVTIRCYAQEHEAAVLVINIQKLNQMRETLDQLYKGYQLISDGYNKIKKVTSGNFELHDLFLDALFLVNPTVKKYRRVADIIDYQLKMIKEHKAAYKRFSKSGAFKPEQLEYLSNVYARLIDDSLENVGELAMIITARQLRMSDDERISGIDRIYKKVEKQLHFLRAFNNEQTMLAIERTREQTEINTLKNLYGVD